MWTDASKRSTDKDGKPIAGMIRCDLTQLSYSRQPMPISLGTRLLQGHERNHTVPIFEWLAVIEGYKDNYYPVAG